MTVHVLIPVFNRLSMTKTIIEQLYDQCVDEDLRITVIDDGSSDGTAEYLKTQKDIRTITGNGNLWWGGAVGRGLSEILPIAGDSDWVLLMNNDTQVRANFVQGLLDVARSERSAAICPVLRDVSSPYRLLSIGPKIDPEAFAVNEIEQSDQNAANLIKVDALSGRGALYPVAALKAAGGMRPYFLPHYFADYELSLRVKAKGWQLLVATKVSIYTEESFGTSFVPSGLWGKYFSIRSPSYLPASLLFWWQVSPFFQRLSMPFRLFWYLVSKRQKKWKT